MDMKLCNSPSEQENEYSILQDMYIKGDDIQKLSVIQALPQLLQYDPNGTITRIVPKIQQELPKSSCEFHIATSKIFKVLIENQLPLNLTSAVLQGTESKDPAVSNAWIETLLAIIPTLTLEQVKANVVPLALYKSQPSSPVYCRISSCKLFGKCTAHPGIESIYVKTTILPAVQALCQDCFPDVRATMCSQLHFIAKGLGENLVKSSLLPSLVELASDDNVAVRSSAVAAAVLVIPYLNKQTKIETIVPLIKQLCQQKTASGLADPTYPTMAREFGKLVDALKNDLETADCLWMLQFYKTLSSRGHGVRVIKDNSEVTQDVICREQCAFNLPAVTLFTVLRISSHLELWHTIFSGLANDSCYVVRKTTAGCVHEVVRILGSSCNLIKEDFVKLLRDDAEEVLQMLVPNLGTTLELFCVHGVLSRDTTVASTNEITKALLKCHGQLSRNFNWRIKTEFLQQIEHLPNCMPSDFIHQHFSPIVLNCVLEARTKPLKSQASRTLLVFLRYNVKEIQRKWIRDNLITHLCYSKSCYMRHIFILACGHAIELFSNSYFKKFFFEPLMALADDPVSNIRLCVVSIAPSLCKMLVLPEDRKLQTIIDNTFSKLEAGEKDKDVKERVKLVLKEIRASAGAGTKPEYLTDQKRKEEEESKISQGKSVPIPSPVINVAQNLGSTGKASVNRMTKDQSPPSRQPSTTKSPSTQSAQSARVNKPPANQAASDMSFLEQHFYIDAGVSFPCEPEVKEISEKLALTSVEETAAVSTLSVENVDIESMSESDLEKLETSTTNITDDVKVNLRRRSLKTCSKLVAPKVFSQSNESRQRNSLVEGTMARMCFNRRSLNLGASDLSKIPVCLKKSKSNADVQVKARRDNTKVGRRGESEDGRSVRECSRDKKRPRSEILTNCDGRDRWMLSSRAAGSNSIRNNVPITNSIKDNNSAKPSGLPVFKRKPEVKK